MTFIKNFCKIFQSTHTQEFQKDVRILFILKYREKDALWLSETECYSDNTGMLSSGLFNSASFASEYLVKNGVQSKLVHVEDNNGIDKVVTEYKPTHVIIEAFWVVPEKFDVLCKLHPSIKWIIRNHSHTPFLANEGIGFDWSMKYLAYPNVYLSCNHEPALHDMRELAKATYGWDSMTINQKVIYHPNLYPVETKPSPWKEPTKGGIIRISSFGAIRPLKNQVSQAIAAIKFAHDNGYKLEFHINGTRKEGNGDPILKNIRAIFSHAKNATLVEHSWLDHDEFLKLVGLMHIGLQVTYTETFNIVAADFISQQVPVIVSDEIAWVSSECKADPNNVRDIVETMEFVLKPKKVNSIRQQNFDLLVETVKKNSEHWKKWP